jgi:preprotein translocase subunit SecB
MDNQFINMRFKEAKYPAILYIEKGYIKNIEYQNPNNPAAIIQLVKWLLK